MVSTIGATGTVVSALYFLPRGQFLLGMFVVLFFVLFDLLDGTLARLSETGSSPWGALLDSTLDRISDASILAGVVLFLSDSQDPLTTVTLVAIVAGGLVSYIKAKAESLGITCNGGFAERTERLIIALAAIFLAGLGVPYILTVGMWILALASIYTMIERAWIVFRATQSPHAERV